MRLFTITTFALRACLLSILGTSVFAQSYPSKPIRTILSFGGGSEGMARLIAQRLSDTLGQPVIVEVQSGANGAVGSQNVAKASPDGHTLLFTNSSAHVVSHFLSKNTGFDPFKQFSPIAKTSETMLLLVANNDLPVKSVTELIEYAKRNPGKLSYGTSGIGSTHHLSGEQIKLLTGINWVHVPYKAGPPVVTETMTGLIHVGFTILSTASPFLNSGKLKILAINNDKRLSILPNIPTISEQIPGYEAPRPWSAYFGPAGVPKNIVDRLSTEIVKIMQTPDVQPKLEATGVMVSAAGPEEVLSLMKRDVQYMEKLVSALGLKPE